MNISLSRKNGIKRLDKVIERIGRLKGRFKRVAYHYDVSIKKDLETNKAVDISWHLKDREKTEGVYVLRTNREELKEEQIWNIHNMLADIKDAFRCMKSELGLRPIYHKKEERGTCGNNPITSATIAIKRYKYPIYSSEKLPVRFIVSSLGL